MDKTQTRREKWRVRLDGSERGELKAVIDAERRRRAHILLLADEMRADGGRTDADIAAVVDVGTATVERVRRRCVEEGLEVALERRVPANRKPRKLDGAGEAALTMIACSEPPEGRAGWTLALLGEHRVEMGVVESISTETVRVALKNSLKPWRSRS